MRISQHEQNTPEWGDDRLGVPSASCFKLIVDSKGMRAKPRKKYLYKLAGEICKNKLEPSHTNKAMDDGHEHEGDSRDWYSFAVAPVLEVGFCLVDSLEYGCSPDGLVGDKGGFETKNACGSVQIDRLENGWRPADHFQQVQGCLLVTGREWWDLVSYSEGLTPVVKRCYPDVQFQKLLKIELKMFHNELMELVTKYKQ